MVFVSLAAVTTGLFKPFLERLLFVGQFVVDFLHVFNAPRHHEYVVPAIRQVIQALLTELSNLVPPCEEVRLVRELTGLVIGCDNLKHGLFGKT